MKNLCLIYVTNELENPLTLTCFLCLCLNILNITMFSVTMVCANGFRL